ncbi:hypothetical protein IF1G_03082 [Cordyceps javanica]|uniref:Uncharacterized protein n=1 Tax=Cordyceps javanica TaxID=43265 RepID=A0A545VB94_9HYPO|nr:hypothetical protein IF1G_03082 [Cordyceps javanica]
MEHQTSVPKGDAKLAIFALFFFSPDSLPDVQGYKVSSSTTTRIMCLLVLLGAQVLQTRHYRDGDAPCRQPLLYILFIHDKKKGTLAQNLLSRLCQPSSWRKSSITSAQRWCVRLMGPAISQATNANRATPTKALLGLERLQYPILTPLMTHGIAESSY